jgi:hypothetical protein
MVAFDAVSSATPTSGTTSPHTWTHTGVGSNLAIVAMICLDEATSSTTVACTYNSVSMSLLGAIPANNANNGYLYFFGVPNMATGAQTVSFTFSGSTDVCVGASISWTGACLGPAAFGAFQPSPLSGGEGTGTNPSEVFHTTVSGSSLVGAIASVGTITSMSGGGQKFLANNTPAGACGSIVGSTAVGTGGNITYTSSIATGAWAFGGLEVLPTPPSVTSPRMEATQGTNTIGQAIRTASQW